MSISLVSAAISAAGAILGGIQKGTEAHRTMEQYGIDMAAIDINAAMQQEALSSTAAKVLESAQGRHREIEKNRATDEANAKVAAAVSGTEGQSVDLTETEIEASAGIAKGNLLTQTGNFVAGLDQISRDIELTADSQRFNVDPLDTRGQLLNVFSSGLMGFLVGEGK